MDENTTPKAPTAPQEIEDVNQSAKLYMSRHLRIRIALYALSLLLFIAILVIAYYTEYPRVLEFIVVPFIIPAIYHGYIRNKLEHVFMQQFAQENNFSYELKSNVVDTIGSHYLSDLGGNRLFTDYLSDVVTGTYKGVSLRLYKYVTMVGSGKSSHQISLSVFETTYAGDVTDIIMESKSTSIYISLYPSYTFGGKKQLSLEGDFNKYFKVYVPEGYEMETLEILTPDIMQELIQKGASFSFEFSNNKLFIYSDNIIENKIQLDAIMDFSETLTQQLAPVLSQLKNDYVK